MEQCFVMQPFDAGEFDRRYDEIYAEAIRAAGFEPYRVDRDPGASIPIDAIERGIRQSAVCFVDISIDNPNVWFEFGYAICANKPMCIVCSNERMRFPFDVQHRQIIKYATRSPSDFRKLQTAITDRLEAARKELLIATTSKTIARNKEFEKASRICASVQSASANLDALIKAV